MADIPGGLVDLARSAVGYGAAGLEALLPPDVAEGLGVSGFRRYMMPYTEAERQQARQQYGAPPVGSSERIEEALVRSGAMPPTTGTREEQIARFLAGFADAVPGPAAGTLRTTTAAGRQLAEQAQAIDANVVSTRFPTAKRATEDPIGQRLIVDYEIAKSDPIAFEHNVNLVGDYPNLKLTGGTPEANAEQFIDYVKNNLVFLHDQVPEATRQRSKKWYDGARKLATDFSNDFDIPDQAVAGVLAVLSPQKDWFMNVSLGERVMDTMVNQSNVRWDDAMTQTAARILKKDEDQPMVQKITGKTLSELEKPLEKAVWIRVYDETHNDRSHLIVTPEGEFGEVRLTDKNEPRKANWGSFNEITKAVKIMEDPSIENISRNLGVQHKVRNFYNNIYVPNDPGGHVTIDTHAVAAGLFRPLSAETVEVYNNFGNGFKGSRGPKNSSLTGMQGTYSLYAEAYRRAAAERGILPREMQSITWEAVRGLYPDKFKGRKVGGKKVNVEAIDNIWSQFKAGKISLDEARQQSMDYAGGINAPEWE